MSADELPPYRAVLAVDAERYGSNTDPGQRRLAEAIPEVIRVAFAKSGLAGAWEERLYAQDTGDGLGLCLDPRHLPALVARLFGVLQEVLTARDVWMREADRALRLRLRAALHVGPVLQPGGGRALVTAHRLLDAAPLRDALKRSDPDRTFLAVILSNRVHDDVIAAGYATLPTTPVDVHIKEYEAAAHLHIPHPTGDLLASGLVPAAPDPTPPPPPQPRQDPRLAPVHNVITGGQHSGTTIQVGHLHGGLKNA
ncbi:hypothetical protein [Actinokineospora inagensis]|uniref:hypothetical protein n=1 Tax=Actinokineospora inagensis TaxID=103730 RepID=UPI00055524AC|nr:hypothetical protein [Actinokineospora inagensis]